VIHVCEECVTTVIARIRMFILKFHNFKKLRDYSERAICVRW